MKHTRHDRIMQCKIVHYVSTTKFLGVIIDNKFKWIDRIIYIKNIISKSIGIICKMRQYYNNNSNNIYLKCNIHKMFSRLLYNTHIKYSIK